MASSWSRWWPSTHIILPAEASGPGSSPLSSLVMARAPVYLKTSVSIHWWASDVHTFWPLTTNWSPAFSARVWSEARSDPEFGSEYPWHQISSHESILGG